MQLIQVSLGGKAYTYLWEGEGLLNVGEWVQTPANAVVPHPQAARVVAADSDYYGPLVSLTKRVKCECGLANSHQCPGEVT